MPKRKNPFRVRRIRRYMRARRTLKTIVAILVIASGIQYAAAQNLADPRNEDLPSRNQNPPAGSSSIDVTSSSTPGSEPVVDNTVIPQFSGLNVTGSIYNQNLADDPAVRDPLQLYDAVNVWGDLNVLKAIKNTNGNVVVDDYIDIQNTLGEARVNLIGEDGRWRIAGSVEQPASLGGTQNTFVIREGSSNKLILRPTTGSGAGASGSINNSYHRLNGSLVIQGDNGNLWDTLELTQHESAAALRLRTTCRGCGTDGHTWGLAATEEGDLNISGNSRPGTAFMIRDNYDVSIQQGSLDVAGAISTGGNLTFNTEEPVIRQAAGNPIAISGTLQARGDIAFDGGGDLVLDGGGRIYNEEFNDVEIDDALRVTGNINGQNIYSAGELSASGYISITSNNANSRYLGGQMYPRTLGQFYRLYVDAGVSQNNSRSATLQCESRSGTPDIVIMCAGRFLAENSNAIRNNSAVRITGQDVHSDLNGCYVYGYSTNDTYRFIGEGICFSPDGNLGVDFQ